MRVERIAESTDSCNATKTEGSTGVSMIYKWTDGLRAAIERVKAARPVDNSQWLFCNRFGQSYVNEQTGKYDSWSSVWQTLMERVMKETKVTERFTEHDLRAKAGSDVESDERARELLGHSDVGITRRVYRRKALVIRPAK